MEIKILLDSRTQNLMATILKYFDQNLMNLFQTSKCELIARLEH